VRIARSLVEAEQAMNVMRQPATFMTALGRWLLIHDAAAFWNWKNHRRPAFTLQQFVKGRPANTMLACREGKVLAMLTVEVLCAQSSTGTALVARPIENDEIRTAAERIAEKLQLSGFHGLDFMIEDETGYAYLIELNPRCTQLGHLQVGAQGDLVGVLCGSFGGTRSREDQRPISQETIAFFPEVLWSKPKCSYLESSYVDIPREEPRLVEELMRRDWRDRGVLARLYRAIRPPRQTAVVFEVQPTLAVENYAEPTGALQES
jgi:hypothetical protein